MYNKYLVALVVASLFLVGFHVQAGVTDNDYIEPAQAVDPTQAVPSKAGTYSSALTGNVLEWRHSLTCIKPVWWDQSIKNPAIEIRVVDARVATSTERTPNNPITASLLIKRPTAIGAPVAYSMVDVTKCKALQEPTPKRDAPMYYTLMVRANSGQATGNLSSGQYTELKCNARYVTLIIPAQSEDIADLGRVDTTNSDDGVKHLVLTDGGSPGKLGEYYVYCGHGPKGAVRKTQEQKEDTDINKTICETGLKQTHTWNTTKKVCEPNNKPPAQTQTIDDLREMRVACVRMAQSGYTWDSASNVCNPPENLSVQSPDQIRNDKIECGKMSGSGYTWDSASNVCKPRQVPVNQTLPTPEPTITASGGGENTPVDEIGESEVGGFFSSFKQGFSQGFRDILGGLSKMFTGKSNGGGSSNANAPKAKKPTCMVFTTLDSSIEVGATTTLQWVVTDADMAGINGLGAVPPVGRATVAPKETTTYSLQAQNRYGTAQCPTVTITVKGAEVTSEDVPLADPELNCSSGSSALVVWRCPAGSKRSRGSSTEYSSFTTANKLSGSVSVDMKNGAGTFVVRCYDATERELGRKSCSVRPVQDPEDAKDITSMNTDQSATSYLKVDKTQVRSGEEITLTWEGTKTTNCSVVGPDGFSEEGNAGRVTGNVYKTSTFTLSCSAAHGTPSKKTVTIRVI